MRHTTTKPRIMQSLKSLIKRLIRHESKKSGTLISFPKSGRTWVRVMLDQLSIEMEYEHAGSQYTISCHFNELPQPSTIKTTGKQILLLRDPLDTVVSGYFQKTKRKGAHSETIEIPDFVRDPRYGIEKIARFNIAWVNHLKSTGSHAHKAIRYEDLRNDPIAGLTALYTYLKDHAPRNGQIIEQAVEEASFSRMQAKERSGELATRYGSILRPGDANDPESFKVRKGKIGGYSDYLNEEDIAYCNDVLARLDYNQALANCSDILIFQPGEPIHS